MEINETLLKIKKLRNLKDSDLFIIIKKMKMKMDGIDDSYFIGENDELVESILQAKKLNYEETESVVLDESTSLAPLSIFIDNEIFSLKNKMSSSN